MPGWKTKLRLTIKDNVPVIREFRCRDCGTTFESMAAPEEAECPTCSRLEPERVFLTPPAIRSENTSRSDTIVKELASDFGLSNMSNKGGQAVKQAPSGPAAPSFESNPQVMQKLASLGGAGDNFSQVLPTLKRTGGPRAWNRVQDRKT